MHLLLFLFPVVKTQRRSTGVTTEESGEGEAPKSAAYHEWAMLLILAAYDNNNVSGLTALKYAGDYQRGARAGGGGLP